MVKLKRLKIDKYRNVRPGTELHFDDGVNLILGQNGAGKTTLLGLLTYVANSNFSALRGEALDLTYQIAAGDYEAEIHLRLNTDGLYSEDASYDYRAIISHASAPGPCVVSGDQSATRLRIEAESLDQQLPPNDPFHSGFFLDALDDLAATSAYARALRDLFVFFAARFDESLDTFLAMTGRPSVTASAGTPPPSRLLVSHTPGKGAHPLLRQFSPATLASLVIVAHESVAGEIKTSSEVPSNLESEPSQALSFLSAAATAMGFSQAALKPEIKAITRSHSKVSERFDVLGFTFNFLRADGSTIHHDLLSYGQKRLLAYHYYLAATEYFVIADELVNGLHHRWIEACMDAIGERQAFLTSQNPLLFEYVRFDSIEQVQTRFVTCKTEVVDGVEQLVWQNMPYDDAVSFYRGYEADIESIGDILINRGLW